MRKSMLLKSISCILVLALFLQGPLNMVYAINGDNANEKYQEKSIESSMKDNKKSKEVPQSKKIVTKKPNKISPGLAKNEDKLNKWLDKKELVENRTGNSKTYLNEDGSKTAVVFLEPIHIKDSSNKFIDINNNLKSVGNNLKDNKHIYTDGMVTNTTGIYDVYFSNENNNGSITVVKDDIKIQLVPTYTKGKEMVVEGSQVLYPGLTSLIDYLYTVNNTAIKEEIILYNYTDKNTFNYELEVDEKADVKLEENTINIVNKETGEKIYSLSAPYMIDKEKNINTELTLSLQKKGNKYIITLTVNQEWLKDPARVYPVIIDPTISLPQDGLLLDTYVQERSASGKDYNHHTETMLFIGYDDSSSGVNHKEQTRTYIQFPLQEDLLEGGTVISADLTLRNYTGWDNTPRKLLAQRVISSWDVTQVKWHNRPGGSSPTTSVTRQINSSPKNQIKST